MDYYQGVVAEYLHADRCIFMNHELIIQLEEGAAQPKKGTSWISDIVAIDFRKKSVFLCEVTYSQSLSALMQRLKAWSDNWPAIVLALRRDSLIPAAFDVRPWVFIPESLITLFLEKLKSSGVNFEKPPLITPLEMTVPWKHRTWDRREEAEKPSSIPPEMQQ